MRMPSIAILLGALAAPAVAVTPTQQVISMLTEMKAKGEKEMSEEKLVFASYAQWADDRSKELGLELQTLASRIEELIATATKADSDAAQLGAEIEQLDAEIDKLSGEKKAAAADRASQHEEFLQLSTDYAESVDALERAIQTLKAQNYDRSQAEALLQSMARSSPGMPRVLAAFLQAQAGASRSLRGDGAPAVAAYEFQSGGVVELLEGLLDKFRGELRDVETAEANEAHNHQLAELHLSSTISRDESDRNEKAVARGQRAEASAKAKGELAETKKDKEETEKLKADTETTLSIKKAQFEENQKVRAAELEAIAKAVEILSSPEVAASYATHISAPASFLQVGRGGSRRAVSKEQAAKLLLQRGLALKSKTLMEAAAVAAASPFAKVINMIEELLEKLKAEAASEATHKAWCDKELKANKLKRNEKTAEVNKLQAAMEGLEANIAEMGATIEKLAKEQADLTTAMREATELRSKEKAENEATIADAAAGAEAVKQALVILKEFYSSQAPAAALLQRRQVPEMAAYKGMQRENGGVIGMLQVIESDFTRLKSETEVSEHSAAQEYDRFMEESTAAKKQKHEAEFKLSLDKDQAEFEHSQTKKDLETTSDELAKATQYFEELKPACIQVHVSFEERMAQRKEEIEALKEAYKILDQHSAASSQ